MGNVSNEPRTRLRSRPPSRARHGAALLELALVLPLLMTIVLGAVDFGRYAHYYITVTKAAGAGAQFGAFHPFTPTTQSLWTERVRQAVLDEMQDVAQFAAEKLTVPDPVVTIEQDNANMRRVRVEVRYTFDTLVSWPLLPDSTVMTRTVEARVVR